MTCGPTSDNSQSIEMHHNYGGIEMLKSKYDTYHPLSVCHYNDVYVVIMLNKREGIQILRGGLKCVSMKMNYYKWSIDDTTMISFDNEDDMIRHCLLLQLKLSEECNKSPPRIYTCIDSYCNELSPDGFRKPTEVSYEH